MKKREIIWPFFKVIAFALLIVLALLSKKWVFGWFGSSDNVTANGLSVKTKTQEVVEILATSSGSDIGVTVVSKDMPKLTEMQGARDDLYPGTSGSFTFYVNNQSGGDGSYDFSYNVTVENNQFINDEEFTEGFYKDTVTEDRESAKKYIKSHLLFFTNKDGDKYSGWIKPGDAVSGTATYGTPQSVTVYWVWVRTYEQIFNENSDLLAEDTRREIAEHYSRDDNKNLMFFENTMSVESYNMADTAIGVTLKYICYQIEVWGN